MLKKQFFTLVLSFLVIPFFIYGQTDSKRSFIFSGKYLIAFHACNTSSADCVSSNVNKYIYLAYSDDGIKWNPVPNFQPFKGSVPDIVKRGDTLFIYTPDPDIVTRYIISTGALLNSIPITITKSDGTTDDLGDVSSYLDPSTNKIVIFYKTTKGFTGDPINCTTCSLRSATEVNGSNGTHFLMDNGDRLSGVLFSDNDIFYDGSKYILLTGGAGTNKKTLAYSSSTLKGTYTAISTLPNGVLTESGAVPQGCYDLTTKKYWTYITVLSPNAPAIIKRAVHSDFSRQLTDADFTTVLSGSTFPGFTSSYTVESPGFAVNSTTIPSIPTLLSPSNEATGISLNPTLSWSTSTTATTYHLQVAINSNFTSTILNDSTISTSSTQIGPLLNNSIYYWRVNATNSGGTSDWSTTWSFTTIPGLAAPMLISPANSATGISLNPALIWDTVNNAAYYQLQISTNTDFSNIILEKVDISNTMFNLNNLTNNTIYYWWVRASNFGATGIWSDIWKFTTLMTTPSVPNLVFPPNNSTLSMDVYNPILYSLIWNKSLNATEYRVLVSNYIDFSSTIKDVKTKDTVTSVPSNHGATTFWRVRGVNVDTLSDWSDIWNFKINVVSVGRINDRIPIEYKLLPNYPNPFNPITHIEYCIPESQFVVLKVFNTLGKEIEVLVKRNQTAGIYLVDWQPKNLTSGIYFYKIQTKKFSDIKKMLYLR